MKYFKTFEGFKKSYMKKIDLKDFKKIKKGSMIMYMGGEAEVVDNNGYVLTLKKDGKKFTVNKSMFDHGGMIREGKAPDADKAMKDLKRKGSEINWLDDADDDTKKIWKKAGVNPEDENTVILYSYVSHQWDDAKKILKKHNVDFKELEDPNSAGESFIVFVKESVNEAKNTIGLAFKEEQDYLDFVEFIKDERGSIKKDFGWDSKTKSWEVIMDVKVLDRIYGEGTPSNKESGWYGGLPGDFESVIIESVVTEAANVPSNIEKFAKERGVLRDVKQIARWAEKAGLGIRGGTAIGKGYDTLVLDLTYQGAEIYFDTDTGKIKVKGQPVNSWKTFSKAVNEYSEKDGTEASDGKHKHDDHLEEDIEAMWKKAYGEKFSTKYPGVAKIIRQRKITDKREIARIWQETYGENFKEEYPAMWDMMSK